MLKHQARIEKRANAHYPCHSEAQPRNLLLTSSKKQIPHYVRNDGLPKPELLRVGEDRNWILKVH